jgi:hypothetical protein
MSSSFERRKHYRHDLHEMMKIEYALGPFVSEIYEGLLLNISTSGLCLLISDNLDIGQEIVIKSNINLPSQTARIEWIKKMDQAQYKVGLLFKK